nr:hypothetical protein [Tanacetum cinerariifolium]
MSYILVDTKVRSNLVWPEQMAIRVFSALFLYEVNFFKRPCTRNEIPLTLSWERIPRLDYGMRVRMCIWENNRMDTIQLEIAVSTISQEYLLEFTSEYGISEDVHPELPGPEERIVDFLMGKVGIAPNPSKVKTGLRPRAAHAVPLLTATASRVIDMEDPDAATESSGTPSAIEKSLLDFDNENPSLPMIEGKGTEDQAHETVAPEIPLPRNMHATGGDDGADANAPPKVLRKDYASVRPEQSTHGEKSLPTMGLAAGSTFVRPADTKGVNDLDPLSYAEPQPHPEQSMTQSVEILTRNVATVEVEDTHSAESAGSRKSTSSPSMVGSPEDIYHPGWGVAMGSQLRLRFKQEVKLLKKARAQITRRDQRIQVKEEEIKNLDQEIQALQNQTSNIKTLLEAEADMKKAAETKNADLTKELESLRTHDRGSPMGYRARPTLAVMKCAESIDLRQAFANVMFAGIAKGMSEGLSHDIEHMKADRGLEVMEAYDPKANNKYLQALQELKDVKYLIVDQLESLKDALIKVIMAFLHLESDSGEDAPKWIRDLRPSTSQLKIPLYPEKKRCRVVCRTHGISFANHARSEGVPISVPTVAPQGLAILLADAATQTETFEDDASSRLLRFKSLPPMYNLDWP